MTKARARLPDIVEYLFVLVALLLLTEAFAPLVKGSMDDASRTESNPANMLSALAVYMVAFVYLLRTPRHSLRIIGENPLLIFLFALPLVSSFWSAYPEVSARRAIAFAMTGILCAYFAIRLSPEEFMRRLLMALFIGGIASLLLVVAVPAMGIHQGGANDGAWSGVYGHKAILGRVSAIAVAVAFYVQPRRFWESVLRWGTLALFLFLSVMSQSRASWLLMAAALIGFPILALIRARRLGWPVKLVSVLTLVIAVGALSAFAFTRTVESMDRDQTFSGRTELWYGATAVAVENHPFLGAGYRAFWTERGSDGVRRFIDWGYLPDHGHNGYLDVWLELGVPGAAMFAIFIVLAMGRLLKRAILAPQERAWAAMIAFFVVFLLNNMTATVAFKHTDIAWAFAVLAALYAHNAANAHSPATSIRRSAVARRTRQVFSPQPAGFSR